MIETTLEELFTFEALYAAHRASRASRRSKKPIVKFETSMLTHLYDIHKRLNDGTYKFGKYNTFLVYEPKCREIQNLFYSDRLVQRVLCDGLLMPYFKDKVIFDNCVCQKGKGALFALRRFEKMLRTHIAKRGAQGYFLKCDILKYFPSVPHDLLKQRICSVVADERLKAMLEGVIDGFNTKKEFLDRYGIKSLGEGDNTGRGIPIGNQTSQLFGMYYLDPIDRLVKEKLGVKVYSRYMDDFVLVHEDLKYLRYVKSEIENAVAKLKLSLNSKTQIFPLKNGVTYLGFRFCVGPNGEIIKTVKKATKRRFRWRAKLLKKAYCDKVINSERVRQSLSAFHGHLKYSRSKKLEKELKDKLDFAVKENRED
ncbi:MAG: RNA-directed DNA polymerase [Clostridia bacterium]|nr:RNA-directed DNA polymerase [Clostridia bacterium]